LPTSCQPERKVQGAIDMALAVLHYGRNEQLKRLA
jgi:hypothetical protein